MIRSVVLALMMTITLSAASWGQGGPGQGKSPDPGPIGTLLQMRTQLGLSEAQIARLSEIEAAVDRENELPLQQLTEIRRRLMGLGPRHRLDADGRAQYETYRDEMEPLAKQLEENMRAAMGQAIGQLTDAQKRQAFRVLQRRNGNRDRNGNTPRLPSPGN